MDEQRATDDNYQTPAQPQHSAKRRNEKLLDILLSENNQKDFDDID